MKVWVVHRDYVYEGCSEPHGIFSTLEKAKEYIATLKYPDNIELEEYELDVPDEYAY